MQASQGMWDLSSPTRNGTVLPAVEVWILNYWTVREVSFDCFIKTPKLPRLILLTKIKSRVRTWIQVCLHQVLWSLHFSIDRWTQAGWLRIPTLGEITSAYPQMGVVVRGSLEGPGLGGRSGMENRDRMEGGITLQALAWFWEMPR